MHLRESRHGAIHSIRDRLSTPQNKKHHFVPKFYLRNFSKNGKSIGIYNISSQRAISKGNLRNQCYRDYFCGKDLKVERALADMEGAAADLINNTVLKNEAVPRSFSAEHIILSHFNVLQMARTSYEADAMAESTDKLFKAVYREQFGDLDQYEIRFENPVLMSLQVASRMVPAVYDLKIKLLRNDSKSGQRRIDVVELLDLAAAIGFDPREAIKRLNSIDRRSKGWQSDLNLSLARR